MYIQQAFKSYHDWWRYLVGVVIIIFASQLGAIPLIVAVFLKTFTTGGDIESVQDPDVLMGVLDSNLTLFLMLLSFAIGLLGLYFVVKFLHRQPFIELTTSRRKTDWGRIFFGFGLIAVFTVLVTGYDYYANPQDYELQFQVVPFLILAVVAIVMVPL